MADDLVFVPLVGFRSAHALGTRANVVTKSGDRTLTAAITPDRDGIRVQFTVTGIRMDLDANGKRFEDPVRIHDDSGQDISTPRPRWQVGGFLTRAANGTATLSYTTLLEPLAQGVRSVELALTGAAGEWIVRIPVEPEKFVGAPARAVNASDTKDGVTVAARMLARSDAATAIEIEAFYDPPEPVHDPRPAKRWVRGIDSFSPPSIGHGIRERLVLRDDAGNPHHEQGQSFVDPVARRYREVVVFPALPANVRSGTLEVSNLWSQEFGDAPTTLSVPGEADIQVADCDAHLVVSRVGDHAETIRVTVAVPDSESQRQLLYFESLVIPGGDPRGTIGMSTIHCIGQRPYLDLPDPTFKVSEVTLRSPVVQLRGPWTLEIPLA
jgi:hypothetical protein